MIRCKSTEQRDEADMKTIEARGATGLPVDAAHGIPAEKLPGHWLLASLGKRVLRPGGLDLTKRMLERLQIGRLDDVLEFAPGLGITARMTLARQPRSYTAVERDEKAARIISELIAGGAGRCILGTAEATGLPSESSSVVYGEAMLTMQYPAAKMRILREARRLLRRGGMYGIHELCVVPDGAGEPIRREIGRRLSLDIHVGVQPLVAAEWRDLLRSAGFRVLWERRAPMHLLEPRRLVGDEGLVAALRFLFNVLRRPDARKRVLSMRKLFREYRDHLEAVAFVCERE